VLNILNEYWSLTKVIFAILEVALKLGLKLAGLYHLYLLFSYVRLYLFKIFLHFEKGHVGKFFMCEDVSI